MQCLPSLLFGALLALFASVHASKLINVGIILGANNETVNTSDQEQWCVQQAIDDVKAYLESSASPYSLNPLILYAGENPETPAAVAKIKAFFESCSKAGAGIVVGAYIADSTVLELQPLAHALGLTLVLPACGLPDLPTGLTNIVRVWPNDRYQAAVITQRLLGGNRTSGSNAVDNAGNAGTKVAIMSRSDMTGAQLTSLVSKLLGQAGGTEITPQGHPLYYNASLGAADWSKALADVKQAILANTDKGGQKVAFLCNCGNEEIAGILDHMQADEWPVSSTVMFLTDRATPTRSVVATAARAALAGSLGLSGTLSHIPLIENPSYSSLFTRWQQHGETTSLFASALSSYDAVRIAARATVLLGGGDTVAKGIGPVVSAVASTAQETWGASGQMALDENHDLYRALYDVYAVQCEGAACSWGVVGGPIDGRNLTTAF